MLYLITWLTDCSVFLLVFAVPRQLAEQGYSASVLGILGTVFALSSTFTNVFSGRISDRFGRRQTVTTGGLMLLTSITSIYFLDANSSLIFMIAYGLGGAGSGTIYPSLIAWLSHGKTGKAASWAFLRFCLAFNLGMICGQVAGGWLYRLGGLEHGKDGPLIAAMILTVIGLVFISISRDPGALNTDETREAEQHDERNFISRQSAELSALFARVGWIANIGGTFSMSVVFYILPKLAVEMGIPAEQHGEILAVNRIFVIVTFFMMHHSAFWHHRFSTSFILQIVGCVGLVMIAKSRAVWMLPAGLTGLGMMLGYNYFSSLYYSTTGSAEHQKGASSGIHEATLAFGHAAGALLGGIVGDMYGNRSPFLISMWVIVAMLFVQVIVYRRLMSGERSVV